MVTAVGVPPGSSPASRSSARNPGRFVRPSRISPCRTRARFSSVRRITSATVPMAASSPKRNSSSSSRSRPARAWASFRATPTPASSGKG